MNERLGRGVKDIFWGGVIIGIGFMYGGSVFLGNPSAVDWFFDLLGSFWVAKGVFLVATGSSGA